jgi:hypothetical protein
MSLQDRVGRLEAMLPREVPYGDIYDFLFAAEQTIPGPPGSLPEEEALLRLGPKETFVNDRRTD